MRARNTFDRPDDVRPAPLTASIVRDAVLVQLPKHSVAAVEIRVS
jgi:alpha-L-arabinofuranosidase